MRMESDDADEDGFVSWAEYLDSTYGMTEEELEKYKSEDLKDKESKDTMEQVHTSFHFSLCLPVHNVCKLIIIL